jgi:hypothetical protein
MTQSAVGRFRRSASRVRKPYGAALPALGAPSGIAAGGRAWRARRQQVNSPADSHLGWAMGWTEPAEGAALWTGLVVEAALPELAAGRQHARIRNALAQFLPVREMRSFRTSVWTYRNVIRVTSPN